MTKTPEVERLTNKSEREQGDAAFVVKELTAEVERLKAQLPEGMEDCTIRFKQCPKGHWRLTADNWLDQGCHWCSIDLLKEEIKKLTLERDNFQSVAKQYSNIADGYRKSKDRETDCNGETFVHYSSNNGLTTACHAKGPYTVTSHFTCLQCKSILANVSDKYGRLVADATDK